MEPNESQLLSSMEIDAIGEILNISLGSSATSVSELLGQPVSITTPEVKVMEPADFDIKTYEPAIGVTIEYVEGLTGKNLLVLKQTDVKVIVGLLLQTDFSDREFVLDEMNIGAICEVMNQMMGASSTALSQFLNRSINISPPSSFSIDNEQDFKKEYLSNETDIVAVYFNLMIGDLVNSQFINVMPMKLAKELISNFGLPTEEENDQALDESSTVQTPAADSIPAQDQPTAQVPVTASVQAPVTPSAQQTEPPADYNVTNAMYPSFDKENVKLSEPETNNLNLIMSVPLQITVEIGRTTKKIKEILDFTTGTIVELNKQAGSQVDIYVNGKAIAKGSVVVVDDYYGVRITEVINSNELMKLL